MATKISSINSSGVLSTWGELDEVSLESGSIYFNGSSALTFTANSALAFGSGAYTVELWYNPSADYSGLTNGYLFDHANNQTRLQLWQNRVRYFYNNGATELTSPTDGLGLSVGTWYHLAIVRNSANLITMYINGVGVASVTYAVDENQTSFNIGQSGGSSSRFTGYISNFRIVKGVAVYTSNFTRPTVPLTAVSNTSLLLNNSYQGAFVDTSGNNLQFTQVGTPVSSTITPPFLTKSETVTAYKTQAIFDEVGLVDSKNSIYFNGSSALRFTANSSFEFGVGEYTVEMWYNPSADYSGANNGYLFDHADNQTRVQLWQNRVKYFYNTGGSGTELSGSTNAGIAMSTWHHLAIVRNSSNLITMYINGVSVASVTSSVYESQQDFTIGQAGNGTSKFTGYISNFRLVKGVAVYTGNFTPPLAPLLPINSTQLLVNYSYLTNSIVDKSSNNFAVTSVGSPSGSTQTPFNSTTVQRINPSSIQVLGYFDEYSLTNV